MYFIGIYCQEYIFERRFTTVIDEMAGHYEPYYAYMELSRKSVCPLKEFLGVINRYERNGFYMENEIVNLGANFKDGGINNMYNTHTRFSDEFYVNMQCAKIKTLLHQGLKALQLLKVLLQTQVDTKHVYEYIDNLTDAKQSYDAAFINLADICNSTDIQKLKEYGIYCRQDFEEKYGLTWVPKDDHSRR